MKLPSFAPWRPIAAALLAAACSTAPEPRYFVLDALGEPGPAAAGVSVLVGPVAIPDVVDRPQFVLSSHANEVVVDDQHRWASPLQDGIAEIVSSDLAAQLGGARVTTSQAVAGRLDYRVSVAISGFRSTLGEGTLLEASWSVRRADGAMRDGRSELRERAQGGDYAALAAAHSRAIARMSAQIAEAIRALGREPPTAPAR
jgi:uncharacterized protein